MDSNITGLGAFTRLIALYVLGWFAALAICTGFYSMDLITALEVKTVAGWIGGPVIFIIAGWRVAHLWWTRGANWVVSVIVHVVGAVALMFAGLPAVAMFIPFVMLVVGLMAPVPNIEQ